MKLTLTHNGEPVELDATLDGDTLRIRLPDGSEKAVVARRLTGGVEIRDGNRIFRVTTARGERGGVAVSWDGAAYPFDRATPTGAGAKARKGKASGVLVAPMVGTVTAVHVAPGDRVAAYQPVAVVEAMKVLATLEAPFAGTVRAVRVRPGQSVQQGAVLVEMVADEEQGSGDGE